MTDYDREPGSDAAGDPTPPREHVTERTTIVTAERRGGGSGWIIAIVLLIALFAVLFLVFGDRFGRAADDVGVNVNIDTPDIEIPDKVKVELPDEITVDSNSAH
jgi:hypothetical protein